MQYPDSVVEFECRYLDLNLAPYGFDAQGGRFGKADKFIVLDWETAD